MDLTKQYLIELSDNEYKIVNEMELMDIEQSGIDFDGFTGIRNCGTLEYITNLPKEVDILKKERDNNFKSRSYWKEEYDLKDIENQQLKGRVKKALVFGYEVGVQHDKVITPENVSDWEDKFE